MVHSSTAPLLIAEDGETYFGAQASLHLHGSSLKLAWSLQSHETVFMVIGITRDCLHGHCNQKGQYNQKFGLAVNPRRPKSRSTWPQGIKMPTASRQTSKRA